MKQLAAMKIYLFLALIGGVNCYFEPEELPCKCSVTGGSLFEVHSYDGALLTVFDEQKTLISQWNARNDRCKFELRAVIQLELEGEEGDLYVNCIGVAFDKLLDPDIEYRNVMLEQSTIFIRQRGWGFYGNEKHPLPFAYVGPESDMDLEVMLGLDEVIRVRSNTCPFAVDFYPRGRDTRFDVYVGNQYRDNTMTGLCGNCNEIDEDDYRTCPTANSPSVVVHDPKKLIIVADSCRKEFWD